MITGKVSSTPRNAYFRCDGKGFNSSLGGFSSEGNTLSSIGDNFSNLGAHLVVPLSLPNPFWQIRTESGMPCYHSITQNQIFTEVISI